MKTNYNFNGIKVLNFAFSLISIVLILMMAACGSDDPQPETDRVSALLTASPWKIQSVTVDGTDKTATFGGLILTFLSTNFTTTNGGIIWPANGTWTFADTAAKSITRSDGVSITLEDVNETKLVLKLNWTKTTLGGGRVSSIAGSHTFTFGK